MASTKARLVDFGEMEQGKRKIGGILNSALVWFFGGEGVDFGRLKCLLPNPPFWGVFFSSPNWGKKCGRKRGLNGNLPIHPSPPFT